MMVIGFGEVQFGRLGPITMYVVFRMLGYVLVPITPAPRRELGLKISRNEELLNIYRQTPHKLPHEASRIRRVLLGTAAQLCRNIA
jgi:hypothetical protein